MGASIDRLEDRRPTTVRSLGCLEIIGPPGSGKTTLSRELSNRPGRFRLRRPPDWKRMRYFPFFVRNGLSLAPVFASLTIGRQGRRLNRYEFLCLIVLNGWHRLLTRRGPDRGPTILDQGPVYMLSQMILWRERQMGNPLFRRWWKKTLGRWGQVLEGLIWLDAADDVLAQRIDSRGQNHIIKGASFSQVRDFLELSRAAFLDRSRAALNQAIIQLQAGRCTPAVMRFDTSQQSLNEIVDRLTGV